MPPPPAVAEVGEAYADEQAALSRAAVALVDAAARERLAADPAQWRDAVADRGPQLLALQQAAVEAADPFVTAALHAQGADPIGDGVLNAAAFVDQTDGGGSWLRNLVYAPPSAYQDAIAQGSGATLAESRARYVANAIALSAMQDVPRSAVTTAMRARRRVKGYVRCLRGKTCGRCAILAGRRYFVEAFRRHPRCDCYHVPVAESIDGDWTTSPKSYFRSLTSVEQDEVFGQDGAAAIRHGADMAQVVNADLGVTTVAGLNVTTSGTARGLAAQRLDGAPRLMPDEIFALAEREGWTREQTLEALHRYAYLL